MQPATLVWAEIIVARALNGEDTKPVLEVIARSGIDPEELLRTVESVLQSVHDTVARTPSPDLASVDDFADPAKP